MLAELGAIASQGGVNPPTGFIYYGSANYVYRVDSELKNKNRPSYYKSSASITDLRYDSTTGGFIAIYKSNSGNPISLVEKINPQRTALLKTFYTSVGIISMDVSTNSVSICDEGGDAYRFDKATFLSKVSFKPSPNVKIVAIDKTRNDIYYATLKSNSTPQLGNSNILYKRSNAGAVSSSAVGSSANKINSILVGSSYVFIASSEGLFRRTKTGTIATKISDDQNGILKADEFTNNFVFGSSNKTTLRNYRGDELTSIAKSNAVGACVASDGYIYVLAGSVLSQYDPNGEFTASFYVGASARGLVWKSTS